MADRQASALQTKNPTRRVMEKWGWNDGWFSDVGLLAATEDECESTKAKKGGGARFRYGGKELQLPDSGERIITLVRQDFDGDVTSTRTAEGDGIRNRLGGSAPGSFGESLGGPQLCVSRRIEVQGAFSRVVGFGGRAVPHVGCPNSTVGVCRVRRGEVE